MSTSRLVDRYSTVPRLPGPTLLISADEITPDSTTSTGNAVTLDLRPVVTAPLQDLDLSTGPRDSVRFSNAAGLLVYIDIGGNRRSRSRSRSRSGCRLGRWRRNGCWGG